MNTKKKVTGYFPVKYEWIQYINKYALILDIFKPYDQIRSMYNYMNTSCYYELICQ